MMPPLITSTKPELRSKRLDRRQCCWHVSYQFCDLSAEITVYAENEADARASRARPESSLSRWCRPAAFRCPGQSRAKKPASEYAAR
jgi:hypothetical protein